MRRRYVGLLVLGSLLLAGCGNQASAGHHSDPMYGAPPVGACYALTSRQIDQTVDERNRFSHGRRVSCSSSHTSVTAGVAVLPHGLRWSDGGKAAYLASLALCTRLSARTISADPALARESAFGTQVFRPSPPAQSQGARWVRCDVLAWDTTTSELQALPPVKQPFLDQKLPDRYWLCVSGGLQSLAFVNCSAPHRYRVEHAEFLTHTDWPGDTAIAALARRTCDQVDSRPGTVWFHTPRNRWDLGDRVVWCAHVDSTEN